MTIKPGPGRIRNPGRRLRAAAAAAAITAVAAGGLCASAAPASAVTSGGGCRTSAAPVAFNVSLQPCAYYSSLGWDAVDGAINVWGTPTTSVLVWIAPAVVNSDGSVTDTGEYRYAYYASPDVSQNFSEDFNCVPGRKMVIDSWLTDNGVRYGSVQSKPFWC